MATLEPAVRKTEFKKTFDGADSRRRREDNRIQLRKQNRDQQLAKRRQRQPQSEATSQENQNTNFPSMPVSSHYDDATIQKLTLGLQDQNEQVCFDNVRQLRKILSIEKRPPIQQVIKSGAVPHFVRLLNSPNTEMQFEVAWALTNIASGNAEQTRVVARSGAVQCFGRLLSSKDPKIREQVAWALGNISGDCVEYRDSLLKAGIMAPLLSQIHPKSPISLLRTCVWVLSNLCRGQPAPPLAAIAPAIPVLSKVIATQDDELLTDTCWALSYITNDTDKGNPRIQQVLQSGCLSRVVQLMQHPNDRVQVPALRIIGNIVTGDDKQTSEVIKQGALFPLAKMLNHIKRGIRKESCWAISNITAGTKEQIEAVIKANLVRGLVSALQKDEFDIKKEAAWAICNATSNGTEQQIRHFVSEGCITALCNILTCHDASTIKVCLEGLDNILKLGSRLNTREFIEKVEQCQGDDKLDELQQHENEDIYKKAVKLLTEYFTDEEEDDDFAFDSNNNGEFDFGSAPVTANIVPSFDF